MTNSGTELTPDVIARMAQGYFPAGITDSLEWQGPDGQIYSTARDMAKFASLMFRTNVPGGSVPEQVLDGITIA
jgi:CubicO group peptidase (beta-lactamase class C family)